MRLLRNFIRDESGATAMEYAIIAGFIALVIVTSVRFTGSQVNTKLFQPIASGLPG